jgi:hypothetical protein
VRCCSGSQQPGLFVLTGSGSQQLVLLGLVGAGEQQAEVCAGVCGLSQQGVFFSDVSDECWCSLE